MLSCCVLGGDNNNDIGLMFGGGKYPVDKLVHSLSPTFYSILFYFILFTYLFIFIIIGILCDVWLVINDRGYY